VSLTDHAKQAGAKPVKQPILDSLTEDILDEIVEAREAFISWGDIAQALQEVHNIKTSGQTLGRRVPDLRPETRIPGPSK
jgi:hypothetical protein